jgi:hypothetical protein
VPRITFSHRDARVLICEGYRRCFGVEPERSVAQLVQAVGVLESNYGAGWSNAVWDELDAMYGTCYPTWGAITATMAWTGKTFEHRDSRPATAAELAAGKGPNIWYITSFRVHDTAADAAKDLVRVVCLAEPRGYVPRHKLVMPAAKRGDAKAFSAALYDTGYYRGFGPDRDTRIAGHHKAVSSALARIAKALGEEPPSIPETTADLSDPEWDALRVLAVRDRINTDAIVYSVKGLADE